MILKSLCIENIRSYENQVCIEFPLGTSLFEGDIGSGKSTILMALEFALFGLGNQKGDSLLRTGEEEGSVYLEFELGGKIYEIERNLIRKEEDGSVRQVKSDLAVNGVVHHLSPTEIKERILSILNFKEPLNPRAQSVIYRYAIYTPQEEMKEILSQKPDSRLQTLRKAFGIEDYKIAAENAALISKAIKEKIRYLEGKTSDLEEKKKSLSELNENLKDNKKDLSIFMAKREELNFKLQEQKTELDELKESESDLKSINNQIPHLKQRMKEKVDLSYVNNQEIRKLKEENQNKFTPEIEKLGKLERPTRISEEQLSENIKQIKKAINNRNKLTVELNLYKKSRHEIEDKIQEWKDKSLDVMNQENEKLASKLKEHEDLLNSHQKELDIIKEKIYKLQTRMDDVNQKLENLDGLGEICPICGSKLNDAHRKELKKEREKEIRKLNSELSILTQVKPKAEDQIQQDKTKIKQHEKDLREFELLMDKFNELNEVKTKINSIEGSISIIDEKLALNIEEGAVFENFEQYINQLENLLDKLKAYNQDKKTLENLIYQLNKNNEKIVENTAKIEELTREIGELEENLSNFQEKVKYLPDLVEKIGELQETYKKTDEEHGLVNNQVIAIQTSLESLSKRILELEDEVKEKEQLLKQLDKLYDYNNWLLEYLIPTLSVIEKHIMNKRFVEFNDDFQKWFNILIDDESKTVKLNEEFTPLVEQDNIEQNINYLSGGEKTSVALAYRLALNNVVKNFSTGLKSNLLILDEPTDGFSKEQLFKVREILNELDCPQIIIVSHERELESFADNIFRIDKVDGISKVTKIS